VSRLVYRPIAHDDLDLFAEFLADAEATKYLIVPRPHTRPEAAALLDRWVAQHDGTIGMYTALFGGETVGWVGFAPRALRWGDELELGWSIRRAHWGHGYATEAALALRPLGPDRVVHLIHPANTVSVAVAKRLGGELEREITIRSNPVAVYVSPRTAPAADPTVAASYRGGGYE
jgi:RimJ/RimL family protein N-acetyltransferase